MLALPMITIAKLRQDLERNAGISNEEWLSSLSLRKREELAFHDLDRDRGRGEEQQPAVDVARYANRRFYTVIEESRRYIDQWIADRTVGRVVLDYACGNGLNAIQAAKAGASLAIGLDISRVSVANAVADAAAAGVSGNTAFVQGDCENTRLPDNSVDVVICSGMLHHLDLSYAFPELRRVMKPGAVLLAIEALDHNPVIRWYRHRTPQMRTAWEAEHILSSRDLRFAARFFDVRDVRYWHLCSLSAVPFVGSVAFRPMLRAGNVHDRFLLRVPCVRLMA